MKISGSTIKSFQSCERRNFYEQLGYEPCLPNVKMFGGSLFHEALYWYYERGQFLDRTVQRLGQRVLPQLIERNGGEVIPERLAEYEAMIVEIEATARGYVDWQANDKGFFSDKNLRVVGSERPFIITLKHPTTGTEYQVEGIIDGVRQHKETGQWYIFETKTTGNPARTIAGLDWDWQPRIYLLAVEELYGRAFDGVIYNIVTRSDPDNVPLKKNGEPSKARTVLDLTTKDIYTQAVVDSGASLEDYQDFIDRFDTDEAQPLYQRHIFRMPESKARLKQDLLRIAWRMKQGEQQWPDPLPSYNRFTCHEQCRFSWVCLAHSDGADWESLLEAGYTTDRLEWREPVEQNTLANLLHISTFSQRYGVGDTITPDMVNNAMKLERGALIERDVFNGKEH